MAYCFANSRPIRAALVASLSLVALTPLSALALDQIIKPYESVRSSGMGGVTLTTGLYDENFFGNPARVTENPHWRVTILDPMVETNSHTENSIKAIDGGNSVYSDLGQNAGANNHFRLQTTMPSVYLPPSIHGKWAFALGLITSSQVDLDLRRSFNIDPSGIIDIGPALTVGRRLLEDNALTVGATAHVTYRLSTNSDFSIVNLISGESISPRATGGQGGMLDFDVGMTYVFKHYHPAGVNFSVGAALDNMLGGNFNNLKLQYLKDANGNPSPANKPIGEPRRVGTGFAVEKDSMGMLHDTMLAFEFQDIGNNTNGALFRTAHLGGETHLLHVLAVRAGINQGYLCGGVGLDLKLITLDVSTYGEEMSLNPGGLEDRRIAAKLAFQI
jgi:hypothetical protein